MSRPRILWPIFVEDGAATRAARRRRRRATRLRGAEPRAQGRPPGRSPRTRSGSAISLLMGIEDVALLALAGARLDAGRRTRRRPRRRSLAAARRLAPPFAPRPPDTSGARTEREPPPSRRARPSSRPGAPRTAVRADASRRGRRAAAGARVPRPARRPRRAAGAAALIVRPRPRPGTRRPDAFSPATSQARAGADVWVPTVDEDMVELFFEEANERLEGLAGKLVEIERRPDDGELLRDVFRDLHTVKGSSAMVGLAPMNRLAHAAEDLVGQRARRRAPRRPRARRRPARRARRAARDRQRGRAPPAGPASTARRCSRACATPRGRGAAAAAAAAAPPARRRGRAGRAAPPPSAAPSAAPRRRRCASTSTSSTCCSTWSASWSSARTGLRAASRRWRRSAASSRAPPRPPTAARRRAAVGERDEAARATPAPARRRAVARRARLPRGHAPTSTPPPTASTRLRRAARSGDEAAHDPIGGVFRKHHRTVRDLASASASASASSSSARTPSSTRSSSRQLDEPLMHLVRNAVDHGIETPEQRAAAGKPPEGVIACGLHRGNQIVIEIADDGRGIDPGAGCAEGASRRASPPPTRPRRWTTRRPRADLPARLLDRRARQRGLRARRRHGRRAPDDRQPPQGHDRPRRRRPAGHDLHAAPAAHARDHPGPARPRRRRGLRDPARRRARAR